MGLSADRRTADDEVTTASGIPVPAVAGPDLLEPGWEERVGAPGSFPYTRGIRPRMYRDRPWTIRQLAGFGAAADTNGGEAPSVAQGRRPRFFHR